MTRFELFVNKILATMLHSLLVLLGLLICWLALCDLVALLDLLVGLLASLDLTALLGSLDLFGWLVVLVDLLVD